MTDGLTWCLFPGCSLFTHDDNTLCAVHRTVDAFEGIEEPVTMTEGPPWYTWHPSGVQAKTIAQEFPYNVGAAIAYLWRMGRKPGVPAEEDITDAIAHLEFELERIQRK